MEGNHESRDLLICLLAQYLEIMKMAAISTITRNQRGIAKKIVPWLSIWLLITDQ